MIHLQITTEKDGSIVVGSMKDHIYLYHCLFSHRFCRRCTEYNFLLEKITQIVAPSGLGNDFNLTSGMEIVSLVITEKEVMLSNALLSNMLLASLFISVSNVSPL